MSWTPAPSSQQYRQQYPQGYLQLQHPNLQQSHPNLQQPHPNLQQSHPNLQQPHPSSQQPHPSSQQPHPSLQQPHPSLQQPHPSLQQHHANLYQQTSSLQQYNSMYLQQHMQLAPTAQYHAPPRPLRDLTRCASHSGHSSQQDPHASATNCLHSRDDCTLLIRQQPAEALVTIDGKEKCRKPIDPPPILQLTVSPDADLNHVFVNSPSLFCTVHVVGEKDEEHVRTQNGRPMLLGTLSSSIHRLKDSDNEDGGFFVFGDISVREIGVYRLKFALFDLQKRQRGPGAAVYLADAISTPFKVLHMREFKGLNESTYISRTFSDQGVRLRLRKEARRFGKPTRTKRSRSVDEDSPPKEEADNDASGFSFMSHENEQKKVRYESGLGGTLSHSVSVDEAFGSQGGAVRPPTSSHHYSSSPTNVFGAQNDVQQSPAPVYRDNFLYPNPTLAASSASSYGGFFSTAPSQDSVTNFFNTNSAMNMHQPYPAMSDVSSWQAPAADGLGSYQQSPFHNEQNATHDSHDHGAAATLSSLPAQRTISASSHHQASFPSANGFDENGRRMVTPEPVAFPRPKSRYQENVARAFKHLKRSRDNTTEDSEQRFRPDDAHF